MMRTLRDMNMSKFVAEDMPLFLSLIDDLFPGLRVDKSEAADVLASLEKARDRAAGPGPGQVRDQGRAQELAAPGWARCGGNMLRARAAGTCCVGDSQSKPASASVLAAL